MKVEREEGGGEEALVVAGRGKDEEGKGKD